MAIWTYTLLYVVALPFVFTSLRHAVQEAFFQQREEQNPRHFLQHAIALAAFGGLALWYSIPELPKIFPDLAFIGVASALVHTARLASDYFDGYSSRSWKLPIRVGVDATANVIVVGLVLAILANDDMKLTPLGCLLATLLAGKECFYRFVVDFKKDKNPRKVSVGGSGAPSSPQMACYHGAINAVKSFYYIFVGFALIYMCLAAWIHGYANVIYLANAHSSHFTQALGFAGRNISLTLSGTADLWLMAISSLEWLIGLGLIALWTRTIPPAATGVGRIGKKGAERSSDG